MKKLLLLLLLAISFAFNACSVDSVENDANKLAKIACDGEREQDLEHRKELREEQIKLEQDFKIKYKDRDEDFIRLVELYLKKLKDCLGYIPVR